MNENLQNPRQIRGLDIAKRYTIKEENGTWFVPSASGKSNRYKVDLTRQNCTCPDFEIRRQKCKHIQPKLRQRNAHALSANVS